MIKVGFFPAHPSQFWMMKALYDTAPSDVEIQWFIRDKDVTKKLIDSFEIPYTLVSKAQRGIIGNAFELALNIFKFLLFSKKNKIDIWLSKYGAVNIAAWILNQPNISFNDDDADIVPLIAYTSYPFANKVLCTNWTRMVKFESKAVFYPSFHELFYLHPNRFTKDLNKVLSNLNMRELQPYVIIRLSSLEAHHDVTAEGISADLLRTIIKMIGNEYQVYISSEKDISPEFSRYQLKIEAGDMHHILAFSNACIADSQTMIAEAAILGIPSLRISTFSKKIGYLQELERRGLCQSILPNSDSIFEAVGSLMNSSIEEIEGKKIQLLSETIDPVPFFWEEILTYQ
ncbi:hypothetical protein [Colwellia sp. 12G3]|uniref:hypothetical protein n=1 Tax=Colwellia sp. 12G3 TaxID=2058299 RepID=UPI000C32618C|nr:hypothetical protein [Colwellia sp. 12G3]PKI13058.1 hypothetical protein CXF71_20375 [Colwellia sp. 12G3]